MTAYVIMAIAALTAVPLLNHFTSNAFQSFWSLARSDEYAWLLPLALLILLFGIWFNDMLESLQWKWLEWSPFAKKANAIYAPIGRKWLGWPYLGALIFCMPLMAYIEEVIFRQMASQLGLPMLLLVSGPVFGLIHITSGVTVRMSIYLSLVGLIFAGAFLATGLAGAFLLHASYNMFAVTWVMFELRIRHPLGRALKRYAATRRHLPTITAWLLQPQANAIH
jgi:hypothetical protein